MPDQQAIILGVVGDSAAGKTTLTQGIVDILGADRVTAICTDDYHKYNRKQRKERKISALHPDCNYIDIIEQHLVHLRRGDPILKPIYNHATGDFDPPVYVYPEEFIIIEGLLGFHSKAMRRNYDVKVYLNPDDMLRTQWKIKRDTTKRGYTADQVRVSMEKRIADSRKWIHPQESYADIVVHFYPPLGQERETGAHLNVDLTLRPTLRHPDISKVIAQAGSGVATISSQIKREDGRLLEIITIDGRISAVKATEIEDIIWKHLPGRPKPTHAGSFLDGLVRRTSYPLAITQLLIAYHMIIAREELERQ